jgi:hypothetical protein
MAVAMGAVPVVAGEHGLIRGRWGDTFLGHAANHLRFEAECAATPKQSTATEAK